jgi:hypothetical protein
MLGHTIKHTISYIMFRVCAVFVIPHCILIKYTLVNY